jgi:hypothetical protein
MRQEDQKFKDSLGNLVRPYLQIEKEKKKKKKKRLGMLAQW